MSKVLTEQLALIDVEAKKQKQALIDEYINGVQLDIDKINAQISVLDEAMKPYETDKRNLLKLRATYEQQIQNLCVHELVEYKRAFVNGIGTTYDCRKCKAQMNASYGHKIVKSLFVD